MAYTPYPNASVHEGFFQTNTSITPNATTVVSEALAAFPDYSVTVTGHSLGGAMAVFAALDLLRTDTVPSYTPMRLITYGQPRVGDAVFAAHAQQLFSRRDEGAPAAAGVFRVVHYNDIVPHVPPALASFVHTPTEVWYNNDMTNFTVCDRLDGEDPTCSNSLWLKDSVSNHVNYFDVRVGRDCVTPVSAVQNVLVANARMFQR